MKTWESCTQCSDHKLSPSNDENDDDVDDDDDTHDDDENLALKRDGALITESCHQLFEENRRLVAFWHLQRWPS